MRITSINNSANSVRVHDHSTRYTKAGLLTYARHINESKYASVGTFKSTITHEIDGGSMRIKHKKPARKEHALFITQSIPAWGYSPIEMDNYLDNIIVFGNSNFDGICESEYGHIFEAMIDDDLLDTLDCYDDYGYKNMTEMINDVLGVKANTHQVSKMKKLCEEWAYQKRYKEDLIADVLTLFTPYTWKSETITGYCQGDWADIVYPTELYTDADIEEFEGYFFGKYMDYRADYCGEEVWFTFLDSMGEDDIIDAISSEFGTNNVKYHGYY